jgi:hypothetical protein
MQLATSKSIIHNQLNFAPTTFLIPHRSVARQYHCILQTLEFVVLVLQVRVFMIQTLNIESSCGKKITQNLDEPQMQLTCFIVVAMAICCHLLQACHVKVLFVCYH